MRHALVDTDGRALLLVPHPADIQDRDGAVPLLKASRTLYPFIEHLFADSNYSGDQVATATRIVIEIVKKNPDRSALPCTRAVGSLKGPSRRSAGTGGWLRMSRPPSPQPQPSSTLLPSCSSSADSLALHDFRNGLSSPGPSDRQVTMESSFTNLDCTSTTKMIPTFWSSPCLVVKDMTPPIPKFPFRKTATLLVNETTVPGAPPVHEDFQNGLRPSAIASPRDTPMSLNR
jgi:hypothetical protein